MNPETQAAFQELFHCIEEQYGPIAYVTMCHSFEDSPTWRRMAGIRQPKRRSRLRMRVALKRRGLWTKSVWAQVTTGLLRPYEPEPTVTCGQCGLLNIPISCAEYVGDDEDGHECYICWECSEINEVANREEIPWW